MNGAAFQQWLKKSNPELIGDRFDQTKIQVVSDLSFRCMESAQAFLTGLYPAQNDFDFSLQNSHWKGPLQDSFTQDEIDSIAKELGKSTFGKNRATFPITSLLDDDRYGFWHCKAFDDFK
jgi:hypothetical protein